MGAIDEDALVELMRDRGNALLGYAYLLCGDYTEAEDMVQDALVKAYASWGASFASDPEAYVRKVLFNSFLDQHRRKLSWRSNLARLATQDLGHREEDQILLRHEVLRALSMLSPRQRLCLVSRFYGDLSIAEIAHSTRLAEGTVKRHLADALEKLRPILLDKIYREDR